ncbi:hypothetical protein HRbin39_00677 [bacterium HR39]|nr:hypothetical protein HRbin39_00677 [bacterium HR39]
MIRRTLFALAIAALAAACTSGVPPDRPPREPLPVLRLAVGSVQMVDRSRTPQGDFLDRRRSRELAAKAREVLQRQVVAAGGPGSAEVAIERARLVRVPVERESGITSYFRRDVVARLSAELAVRLSIRDETGAERAFAVVEVARERPVLEGTAAVEVDRLAGELAEASVDALVRSLVARGEKDLAAWLALAPWTPRERTP